jgi:hypothetical protein
MQSNALVGRVAEPGSLAASHAMPSHEDNWSLKEYRPKDSPEVWFFRKNLAPEIDVRHPDYRYLAYLTFAYEPRDDSGLPTKEDNDVLFRIEDSELDPLLSDGLAVQVAAVTKSGIKDLLFHTRDPQEFLRRAERFRDTYTQFRIGCEISPDPEWAQYEDFP